MDTHTDLLFRKQKREQANDRRGLWPPTGKYTQARRRCQTQTRYLFQKNTNTGRRPVAGCNLEGHLLVITTVTAQKVLGHTAENLNAGFRKITQLLGLDLPFCPGDGRVGEDAGF